MSLIASEADTSIRTAPPYLLGGAWLQKYHLRCFPFLVPPVSTIAAAAGDANTANGISALPYLQQEMGTSSGPNPQYPKWAPRDCWTAENTEDNALLLKSADTYGVWPSSSAYLGFQGSGFDAFE